MRPPRMILRICSIYIYCNIHTTVYADFFLFIGMLLSQTFLISIIQTDLVNSLTVENDRKIRQTLQLRTNESKNRARLPRRDAQPHEFVSQIQGIRASLKSCFERHLFT